MPRRYLFSDESGDLQFLRNQSATRYFCVGTLLMEESDLPRLRNTLATLRDALAWDNHGLDSYFHATKDSDAIRRRVFAALASLDFQVDVTLLEKAKARPQVRTTMPTFFQYAWYYHLKHLAPSHFKADDEVLIAAAELGTRRERAAFRTAIDNAMTQCIPYRVKRTLAFWPCSSDFALQAVDYCLWAVFRKWERGDDRYHQIIKDKIRTEYDLWSAGKAFYY